MQKLIPEFIQTLIKENDLIDNLVGIGEEKRRVIILGKVQELDKLIQKEGVMAARLETLEAARLRLHKLIAGNYDVPVEELTASLLIQKTREMFPDFIEEMTREIMHLEGSIKSLRAINQENNELIGMSLDYIETMYSMLNGEAAAGTYSDQGMQNDAGPDPALMRLLDKKI